MQQVRYFVALAETLNFTRAAERCNVSQPSLTRAIKLLEDELGGPLFHRERNNTHLTELGRQVEAHLRQALSATEDARQRAKALARLQSAVLRLGIARGLPLAPFTAIFDHFAMSHPGAEMVLPSAEPDELVEKLRGGELELIVIPEETEPAEDLHYYRLAEDRPTVVVAETHSLATREAIEPAAFAEATLICVERCPHWRAAEGSLAAGGLSASPRILVGTRPWLLDLVRAGLGIGVVSSWLTPGHGLVLRPLAECAAAFGMMLATKRGRLYSPPVKAFVEIALTPSRARTVTASTSSSGSAL
ncbi:MAG TPA: LysR family transcriptional regulator [Geminicoccus sp.]|nr:LysR family transcriptional regulator [Geminicoccus sp.]